ncbi:MAG: alpha/beta hydrolase-fold protein [Parafannyhessea sp.]|uniref:alpha/beta hydrolase-fold protein n=1 Tax=Parafannyhessea sp. TaxID=2847324 RepID=UPI003F05B74F
MQKLDASGTDVFLWTPEPAGGTELPVVYLHEFKGDGRDVWEACQALGCPPFALAVIPAPNWDDALSPWPAPPTFKGAQPYAGEAAAQLELLTSHVMPAVEEALRPARPSLSALAGYSLAGLFAAWAPFVTDAFPRVASVSGSLWYPDFAEFARTHEPASALERAYFSVGDREAKTRNAYLRTVEDRTREVERTLAARGVQTTFELNPGNHFTDEPGRTARGIAWLLS